MNYIMSTSHAELIPYEEGDLLAGVPDGIPPDEDRPPRCEPDGDRWPERVAKSLGFWVIDKYPVYWDGTGCHVLSRSDSRPGISADLPARRFKFLALLDVAYEEGIVVGIRDEAALLQFYRLVQPMLTLQVDKRFRWEGHEDGWWNRGRAATRFYQQDVREYQKKHPGWRPGQPRPKPSVPEQSPATVK